jgi:hypothetical protein
MSNNVLARPRVDAVDDHNFLITSGTNCRQVTPMVPMSHCAASVIATAAVSIDALFAAWLQLNQE